MTSGISPGENGSSPHTRGLRRLEPAATGCERIIPAHAGFTPGRPGGPGTSRDHPRTRGVYALALPDEDAETGSSPHTRGLRDGRIRGLGGSRIIPAHAGFTTPSVTLLTWIPDHPRTRGVYARRMRWRSIRAGSSPHTRGLLRRRELLVAHRGIIPAHAGFTRRSRDRSAAGPDHPRTRGVYDPATVPARDAMGSSPHTRGLRGHRRVGRPEVRIIPAHAGFTSVTIRTGRSVTDHPRTRGVYRATVYDHLGMSGSSPHTRGLPGRP